MLPRFRVRNSIISPLPTVNFQNYVGQDIENVKYLIGTGLSIVNALYRLRITDQLFKSYAFTRVVRSRSTLQRLLRRQI
jgi:hypothetical protein